MNPPKFNSANKDNVQKRRIKELNIARHARRFTNAVAALRVFESLSEEEELHKFMRNLLPEVQPNYFRFRMESISSIDEEVRKR
jgi:hypothetical protein